MLITNHVVQGAVIGAMAPGPVSAFVAGVASHFAVDAAPHWGVEQEDFLKVAVPDGLIGLATMTWLARRAGPGRRATVLAGMLGACFPDADKPGELFLGRSPFPPAIDAWHVSIQDEASHRWPVELAAAAVGLTVSAALVRRRRGAAAR